MAIYVSSLINEYFLYETSFNLQSLFLCSLPKKVSIRLNYFKLNSCFLVCIYNMKVVIANHLTIVLNVHNSHINRLYILSMLAKPFQ